MRNSIFKSTLTILLSSTLVACSGSLDVTGAGEKSDRPNSPNTQNVSEDELAGTAFGKKWQALQAVARKTDSGELSLTITADGEDACEAGSFPENPWLTIVLPDTKTDSEYVTDSARNLFDSPVVFIDASGSSPVNIIADKSIVQTSKHTEVGFQLGLYARAVTETGEEMEVNGQVPVLRCDRRLTFSEWQKLDGGVYKVTRFDGRELPWEEQHTSFIEMDYSISDASGKAIPMLTFPLYSSISGNSSGSYVFGPLKDRGVSSQIEENGILTYSYSYDGEIYSGGQKYHLTLDLTVKKDSQGKLEVSYTLEVPGQIAKNSHSFTLEH